MVPAASVPHERSPTVDERQIQQLTEQAREALEDGNHVRAVAITEQLATIVPGDPAVRLLRAEALVKTDAGEEALAEAQQAVELNPDRPHAHTLLGLAAWRAGNLALAQQSLERAIELSGRAAGRMADYAWFMASERGPRLAEQAANEAICANHKSSTAWAALGLAQFRLHRRRAAEASLKRALQLDPNDPYAQSAMASLLHDQRDDASAVALAELLSETPGTEELVESIREEARKRQIHKTLVERGAIRQPGDHGESPGLFWVWPALALLIVAVIVWLVILHPDLTPVIIFLGLAPLVFLWFARRILD
jgi:Tfp pilus assembly protein PilF